MENSDTATAYLGLPRRRLDRPDLVPSPGAVARFVAEAAAGHETGDERPVPATRESRAERSRPCLHPR
ncbi:hypothetical protein [Amycolatopsis sp. CA-128772]|uniref:hypothetical protein n=1 Tax=Amycolatopsis sp. CA-128772 TaxID=2073159 RepID=UPI001E64C088|nr:hypothetical protein [Amycolatopsis sp. CA-128772]